MKHHFGDLLDRGGDYWSFVPNAERYAYQIGDVQAAQKGVSILTVTKTDKNWELLSTLPNLEELTLHEPSAEQLQHVSTLWRLKRLRITHARPKNVEFVSRLHGLEELILEYVSGFDDLGPIGGLPRLRSLHLENLRRVSDFSGLSSAKSLQYLFIAGTLDWKQPVQNFDFLGELENLEILKLGGFGDVRSLAEYPALLPLTRLRKLKKIWIPSNTFQMEEYALLEAAFPDLEGATFDPCKPWFRYNPLPKDDIRQKLSAEDIEAHHSDVRILPSGNRELLDPSRSEYWLIGKGARAVPFTSKKAGEKCEAHRAKYEQAKLDARNLLASV